MAEPRCTRSSCRRTPESLQGKAFSTGPQAPQLAGPFQSHSAAYSSAYGSAYGCLLLSSLQSIHGASEYVCSLHAFGRASAASTASTASPAASERSERNSVQLSVPSVPDH